MHKVTNTLLFMRASSCKSLDCLQRPMDTLILSHTHTQTHTHYKHMQKGRGVFSPLLVSTMQPSARVRACVLHVPWLFYGRMFVDAYIVT